MSTPRQRRSSESSENVAKVPTPAVVDASAGVEMLLLTPLGRRLLGKLPLDVQEWVPELYFAEVAAVLRHHSLRRHYPAARIHVAHARLLTSPVRRVRVRPLLEEAKAMGHSITVAQAVYVVMARHLDAPLVTADVDLAGIPGMAVTTIMP